MYDMWRIGLWGYGVQGLGLGALGYGVQGLGLGDLVVDVRDVAVLGHDQRRARLAPRLGTHIPHHPDELLRVRLGFGGLGVAISRIPPAPSFSASKIPVLRASLGFGDLGIADLWFYLCLRKNGGQLTHSILPKPGLGFRPQGLGFGNWVHQGYFLNVPSMLLGHKVL